MVIPIEPMEIWLNSRANEKTLRDSFEGVATNVAPLYIEANGGAVMLLGSEALGESREEGNELEIDVRVTYRILNGAGLNLPRGESPFFTGGKFYYGADDVSVPDTVEEFTLCSNLRPRFPPERWVGRVLCGDLTKTIYHIWRKAN